MTNKKYAFSFYQIYENDALRDYLEHMALKGWLLTKIGSAYLQFEACTPHPIRYCVEVMEKPSAYASAQTLSLKRYREFCRDAGWQYIGTNGFLHIFCTEDLDAVPVETDPWERFERILRACRGNNRMLLILSTLISLINLLSCWMKKTLLCANGFSVLILVSAVLFFIGDFLVWKHRAQTSLSETGALPCLSWTSVRTKDLLIVSVIFALCVLFLLFSVADAPGKALLCLLLFLIIYVIMMFIFSGLLRWLREKKDFGRGTNMLIYWGTAALLFLIVAAVLFRFAVFFS